MLRRASNVYAQIVSEEEEKVRRFCKFIGSIVAFCLVLLFFVFLLLMVALVVYAGVYYFLVPTKEYTFPLYFDYGDGGAAAVCTAGAVRSGWESGKVGFPTWFPF